MEYPYLALFLFLKKILFIYFWLCWVFISVRGLSLVAASGGHSSSRCAGHSSSRCAGLSLSRCAGLSLSRPLLLRSTGSRRAGSVIVAHGPSCSAACGIFPDQGSNPCPLHWQADSQPLRHQGSPLFLLFNFLSTCHSSTPNFLPESPLMHSNISNNFLNCHFAVHLKLTQYSKSTILQLKKKSIGVIPPGCVDLMFSSLTTLLFLWDLPSSSSWKFPSTLSCVRDSVFWFPSPGSSFLVYHLY